MSEVFEGDETLWLEGERGGGKAALAEALGRAPEADAPYLINAEDKVEPGSPLERNILAQWSE